MLCAPFSLPNASNAEPHALLSLARSAPPKSKSVTLVDHSTCRKPFQTQKAKDIAQMLNGMRFAAWMRNG
jgi:hypothetical protein